MPPAAARTPSRASGSSAARARSPSTARRSKPTSPARCCACWCSSRWSPPTAPPQFDVECTVAGGGLSGQAGAVRHGLSRAITYFEPELRGAAQEGRLPDPRQPRRRAQEVWPRQGPPQLPVLEALSAAAFADAFRGICERSQVPLCRSGALGGRRQWLPDAADAGASCKLRPVWAPSSCDRIYSCYRFPSRPAVRHASHLPACCAN